METYFKKLADLKFDRITTLRIIDKIEDLREIFTDEIKLPFSSLYRMASNGTLPDRVDEMITSIFEELICTKEEYAIIYNQYLNSGDVVENVATVVEPEKVVEQVIEMVEVAPVVKLKPIEVKVTKVVKEKAFPRRYGKENIEKDILKQGSPANSLQRAMLSTNLLKNLYVNMSNKLIKEYFGNAVLTDEDYRKIQSVVTTVERQFQQILKNK
jgi:hypothetical protein